MAPSTFPPHQSGGRVGAPRPVGALWVFLLALAFALPLVLTGCAASQGGRSTVVLRLSDWKTGEVYAEVPAGVNSRLYFGWIHSQEKIPWNEYYHVDEAYNLVLDAITFPAFGAGIPEDKGRICYVRDGLIHMEEIGQVFPEIVWLNSHTATQEITLDGVRVTRGQDLPHHARVRLVIETR